MFDGSLAVQTAQKQAQARESLIATQKSDATASRFSDYVDEARDQSDNSRDRQAEADQRAQRAQTGALNARKKASLNAKEPALTEQPDAPVAKAATAEEPAAKPKPSPDTKATDAKADDDTKPAAEPSKKPKADKEETTEAKAPDGQVLKGDAAIATPATEQKAETAAPAQPVPVQPVVASAPVVTPDAAKTEAVTAIGAVAAAQTAPTAAIAATPAEGEVLADAVLNEAPADLVAARATQKAAPKPATATAELAQNEAIPDIVKELVPEAKPETAKAVKPAAKMAQAAPEAPVTGQPAIAAQATADKPEKTSAASAEKTGNSFQPAESPTRSDASPSVQQPAAQAQPTTQPTPVPAPLPDANLVAGSDGSRLTLTPAPQQTPAAAQNQTAGPAIPVNVNAVAVSIATKAMGGSTRFDIRLDPPELGRIDVRLTLDREGRVKSTMVIEKRETYELMQRDHRNLETAMQQAGLKMNEGSVEFTLRDQTQNGQQNPSGSGFADRDERSGGRPGQPDNSIEATQAETTIQIYAALAQQRGGVDLRI